MKNEKLSKKEYKLSPETIDRIAAEIETMCAGYKMDRTSAIRYRISVEESLDIWMNRLGTGCTVYLEERKKLFKTYIEISAEGSRVNPYQLESLEFNGESRESMLLRIGLIPAYYYRNNINVLAFSMKKKAVNPLVMLLAVILTAIAVGFAGKYLVPAGIITSLSENVIGPIEDTFFGVLSCIAGPMIFLSVAWGIYGIGDVYTLGSIGKKLLLFFLKVVFLFTLAGTVFYPLLGPAITSGEVHQSQFGKIFQMLLDIFPHNIVSPFMEGNTLQIILLAFLIGLSMIFLGQRTDIVAVAVEQINLIINFLMDFISKLVPFFVFIVLVQIIWSDSFSVLTQVWKFAIVFLIAAVLFMAVNFAYVCMKNKITFMYMIKACLPSFMIAITTASSSASFESVMSTCQKKLGITNSLSSFGVPFGMVIFKPFTAMYYLLFCFYFASVYHVQVSFGWIVIAIIIAAISAVATPPIPGGAAATYTLLFLQLGIPSEALAVALAVDMIFDFILTSSDMTALQLELFHISGKVNMRKSLQKPANNPQNNAG